MRKDTKQLRILTLKLFAERRDKGLYATDAMYSELAQREKDYLKREARKLLLKDRLV